MSRRAWSGVVGRWKKAKITMDIEIGYDATERFAQYEIKDLIKLALPDVIGGCPDVTFKKDSIKLEIEK